MLQVQICLVTVWALVSFFCIFVDYGNGLSSIVGSGNTTSRQTTMLTSRV
jgi:hypothetical protein